MQLPVLSSEGNLAIYLQEIKKLADQVNPNKVTISDNKN